MKVTETNLPGVVIIEPKVFQDARGFFLETFSASRYEGAGIKGPFVQDNHSRSLKGTVRGLHLQVTKPQAKLMRAVSGSMLDVAVDVRVAVAVAVGVNVAVAVGVNVAVAVAVEVAVGDGVGVTQTSVLMVSSHPSAMLPVLPPLPFPAWSSTM